MEVKSASIRPAVEAIGEAIDASVGSLDDGQEWWAAGSRRCSRREGLASRSGRAASRRAISFRGGIYRRAVPPVLSEDGAVRLAAARRSVPGISLCAHGFEELDPGVSAGL